MGYFVMLFAGWYAFLSGIAWKIDLPQCVYVYIFQLFINLLAVQCFYSSYLLFNSLKQCCVKPFTGSLFSLSARLFALYLDKGFLEL
jgi:hypothetical protein